MLISQQQAFIGPGSGKLCERKPCGKAWGNNLYVSFGIETIEKAKLQRTKVLAWKMIRLETKVVNRNG